MRITTCASLVLLLAWGSFAGAKKVDHDWSIGKILDETQARIYAGTLRNSSSSATEKGSWSGSANSTTVGDTTNTEASGDYSGTRETSTSGMSVPVYRVYNNLVIEGTDAVYVTSEQLHWRWSKGAHVAVNGIVKYYVDGRKLHVLDEDNKEHTIEIIKEVRKPSASAAIVLPSSVARQNDEAPPSESTSSSQASVTIHSTPEGADIEIDGSFVGNSPSTVALAAGNHAISLSKVGFAPWTKTLNITAGAVNVTAELSQAPLKP